MWSFLAVALFAPRALALTHHLAVGTTDGQALYSLEMDDAARSVYLIQARDAAGASPSLTLDVRMQNNPSRRTRLMFELSIRRNISSVAGRVTER